MAKLVLLSRQHAESTVGEDALYVIIRDSKRYTRLTSQPVRDAISVALGIAMREGDILPFRQATMASDPEAVDTTIVQFGAWCYVDMATSIARIYTKFLDAQVPMASEVFSLPSSMSARAVRRLLDEKIRHALNTDPFLAGSSDLVYPALELVS